MQARGYISTKKKDNVRETLKKDTARNPVDDAPAGMGYQDFHIQYRSAPNRENVIQCFPGESRTLTNEAKKIREGVKKSVAEMEIALADCEISSQFDDEYSDLFVETRKFSEIHETLHHILSRSSIEKFIRSLREDEKRNILLTFLRYTGEEEGDVTQEEYDMIQHGEGAQVDDLIESMLKKTLKSLRSNLTFGPTKRSDDPKDGFDPNYVHGSGQIDAISACYKEAYDKINELQTLLISSQKRDRLVAEIVEKLKEAESLLAIKQNLTGADAYRRTRLEMGKKENWILYWDGLRPFKAR